MESNYIALLRQILAEGSLTQAALAHRLGVTFAAFNRWLNGHAKPRPAKIASIQKVYRQVVGFPQVTAAEMAAMVRKAAKLKHRGIWNLIASREDLQHELLLEHTYNSTSIEGTTFTRKETEAVLFDKSVIADKPLREHLEVTNHAAVLGRILQRKYREPLTEDLIWRMHRDLMNGLREDAGSYSKHHRAIRGVEIALTHPKDIPEEMNRLIRSWNRRRQKNLRDMALFHSQFELIHPFGDGNGRLGRLVLALQCLERNYPPAVIETSRKAEYYEVLEYAQRKSEGPFARFLLEAMIRTRQRMNRFQTAKLKSGK